MMVEEEQGSSCFSISIDQIQNYSLLKHTRIIMENTKIKE